MPLTMNTMYYNIQFRLQSKCKECVLEQGYRIEWACKETWYRIAVYFRRRKLSQIACFCHTRRHHDPNFAEKTFAYSHKTTKFAKVFSLGRFSLYPQRYCDVVTINYACLWWIMRNYYDHCSILILQSLTVSESKKTVMLCSNLPLHCMTDSNITLWNVFACWQPRKMMRTTESSL